MQYKPSRPSLNWISRVALIVFALLFLPMAPRASERGADPANSPGAPTSSHPQIVKTVPEVGAKGVPATLQEITVLFDRDMGRGMSWTGGPPLFPPTDEQRKPYWKDARTCVLPVKLEKGSFYRLGINSTSYRNFRSRAGEPVMPSAIYFTTEGATAAVESQLRAPIIVALEPAHGTTDVDPKITELKVTFDQPMGEGMSWIVPNGTDLGKSRERTAAWSRDRRTCTYLVILVPGREYKLSLNNEEHINFQNEWGVPLAPVEYKFRTRAEKNERISQR